MKLLKGLAIIALTIAFTVPVYAETQSIKLSGDLTIRHISRHNYDFNQYDADVADTDGDYFMHNAEVQLDADLTDNVGVTMRFVNQTDWDVSDIYGESTTGTHTDRNQNITDLTSLDTYGEFDVILDLAYVTLKEFFFTPLTVRIGKQDLWFGKGFIVGANPHDPNGQISADEYTSLNSFKAVRATWDFEPWTLDAVYAQIEENEVQAEDDVKLYGVNLGCTIDFYNAETEVYGWYKHDDEIPGTLGIATLHDTDKENEILCVGTRGSFEPHEDITLWGEYATQYGTYIANMSQREPRDRHAYAADLGGECRLWEKQYAWKPKVGVEYIFYSGQNINDDREGHDYHNWDRIYRGKLDSTIHEYYNVFYFTGMPTTERADTNLHQIIVMGSLQPMDNLTFDARFINFRLHENAAPIATTHGGLTTDNKDVGRELDLELTYDYTEDVTFGLLGAWFWSGDYYTVPEARDRTSSVAAGTSTGKEKDIASKIVATCKVSF